MKRNYWPLFFIGIFGFVFSMIVWTVKSAVSVPVIEDKSFMKKYQDVDANYNNMMNSNVLFLSKYDFDFIINDKKIDLSTDDIKYSQRVIEKISQRKNLLKIGENNIQLVIVDKNNNERKNIDIELIVSKSISADSDQILKNDNFKVNENVYTSTFEIKEENNWIITGSFLVDGISGYIFIKTNAI